jgi:hypothetical protein
MLSDSRSRTYDVLDCLNQAFQSWDMEKLLLLAVYRPADFGKTEKPKTILLLTT